MKLVNEIVHSWIGTESLSIGRGASLVDKDFLEEQVEEILEKNYPEGSDFYYESGYLNEFNTYKGIKLETKVPFAVLIVRVRGQMDVWNYHPARIGLQKVYNIPYSSFSEQADHVKRSLGRLYDR